MTQPTFSQSREANDIEHYGVVGMKWGKTTGGKPTVSVGRTQGSLAREARNTSIKDARGKQQSKVQELGALKQKRLNETSAKGKAKLDSLIADKTFVLKNGSDASLAKQRTTGEKWLKGAGLATKIGLTVVGLGGVVGVISRETSPQGVISGGSDGVPTTYEWGTGERDW